MLLASTQYLIDDTEAVGLWKLFFHSFSSKKLGLEHGTPEHGALMWSWLLSQVVTCPGKNSAQYFPQGRVGEGAGQVPRMPAPCPQKSVPSLTSLPSLLLWLIISE